MNVGVRWRGLQPLFIQCLANAKIKCNWKLVLLQENITQVALIGVLISEPIRKLHFSQTLLTDIIWQKCILVSEMEARQHVFREDQKSF